MTTSCKQASQFNPFEDRLSRDIQNALSSAFADRVHKTSGNSIGELVERYSSMDLDLRYKEYINSRVQRYNCVLQQFEQISSDPFKQAVVTWNQELYFEVHELLEHAWYEAKGNYRLTLQAMIRAAGTYVKMEYGYFETAKKIASKSWPILQENRNLLESFFDPTELIEALQNPGVVAPKLQL